MEIEVSTDVAIAIDAILLALTSLLVIYCASDRRRYPKSTSRFLIIMVVLLWVEVAIDLISYCVDALCFNATAKYIFYQVTFILSIFVPWAVARDVIERVDGNHDKVKHACDIILIFTTLLIVIAEPFNLLIVNVTRDSAVSGPLYPLLFIFSFLLILIGIVMSFKIRSFPYLWRFSIAFLGLVSILAAGLNPVFPLLPMTMLAQVFGATGIVLTTRSYVVADASIRVADLATAKAELAEEKNAALVSQIKPHFIQNSLLTVAYLCEEDPAQAKQLTLDFARYLRGNIDSLNGEDLIPLSKELEHTKTYLAIERARFGDKFEVIYDIQEENFLVPPLSIQPLVENAFKHGIRPLPEGGKIWISTERIDDRYRITIRDNGVGFDPEAEPDTSKSHVGVSNTRNRISRLLGGILNVTTSVNVGTEVVIEFPIKADSVNAEEEKSQ